MISVIITYFNKGMLLLNAIKSVTVQDEFCEIIVVDDCSTNTDAIKTIEQVRRMEGITVIKTDLNKGAAFAKNTGILNASYDIIVLLDADDTLPKNSLKKIKDLFLSDDRIDMIFGDYILYNVDTQQKKRIHCKRITKNNLVDPYKLSRNWIMLGTSPFRKKLWFNIGGFNNLLPRTDDIDFQKRAMLLNANIQYEPTVLYIWNKYPDGNNSNIKESDYIYSFFSTLEFEIKYSSPRRFLSMLIKINIIFIKRIVNFFKPQTFLD